VNDGAREQVAREFTDQLLEQILAGASRLYLSAWLGQRLPIAPWVADVLAWGLTVRGLWEPRWVADVAAQFQADCWRRRAECEPITNMGALFYRILDRECLQRTHQPFAYWNAAQKRESRLRRSGIGEEKRKIG